MESSNKKKKKPKKAAATVSTDHQEIVQVQGASAGPYVFVENCEHVQIGTVNTHLLGTPQPDSFDSSDATPMAKNGAGLIIVKGILLSTTQPMLLTELEDELRSRLKDAGVKTFKELAGASLLDFLIANKDTFDLSNRKRKKYVKFRASETKSEDADKSVRQICTQREYNHAKKDITSTESNPFQTLAYIDESEGIDEKHSRTVAKESGRNGDSYFGDKCEGAQSTDMDENNSWTVVKRKGRKDNACVSDAILALSLSENKQFDLKKFKILLNMPEGNTLMFVPSSTVYEQNEKRFMIDVVSLWNTPDRDYSHIVVGVGASNLYGTAKSLEDNAYQKLFPNEYFTTTPSFECFSLYFNSKLFNVVVVPSSRGCTNPCIVKTDARIDGRYVRKGELWCRVDSKNTICQPTDPLFGNIYRWFLHEIPKGHEKPEMKNGQTNTIEQTTDTIEADVIDPNEAPENGNSFDFFWNAAKSFKRGHFALISGNIASHTKHLNALASLPWIAVYDFDVFSYSSGLLNALQDPIEDQRHLRIRTWKDQAENISEQGTLWCCLRGRREMSETRTDQKDGSVEDKNIWYREVRKGLASNCERLSCFIEDYTVLTLIVLWPENENLVPFICKFLDRLNESLASTPNIVLCLNNSPSTKIGQSRLETICADFETNLQVCCCPYEELFTGITNNVLQVKGNDMLYELPKTKGHVASAITEKDATWLKEDFDVLYLDNPYKKTDDKDMQMQEDVNNFFKGDTLHWSSWYLLGSEQVDIERCVMKQLEDQVHSHIDEYKTSVITLFHSPGSGGTTLAQRTLWKFHCKIPSIHLKLRSPSTLDELDRKVLFVHDKTDLPVLLMIDGEEESKVRCLARLLKYTIILYVKRYPYSIPSENKKDRVFLSGIVSPEEAGRLAQKFGEQCDDRKRKALINFSKEVQSKKASHYLYEFGMTLHLHEFKGIVSHVKGYLQLDKNPTKELTPWQKCLGYLSLVYFYGQLSVPCQFFAGLFNQAPNYLMTLEDFPNPIPHFVVYDKNESRKNNLRICQHIVAKEILEQLLSRHTSSFSKERTDALGGNACRNLANFCIDFIEYASMRKTKSAIPTTTVSFILTKTVIFRDEKDMSENDQEGRRKPVLSKLMIDIPSGKPLFTERLKVLEKLSSSFPDNPNYHAHLGRFHAFCRSDSEDEAERCFQKAIDLCEEQRDGRRNEDLDDGLKLSMMHIYHMYGNKKQRDVFKFTGKSHGERAVSFPDQSIFLEQIQELVQIAIVACEYFTKSREITPHTHTVYNSAYTWEIQVRLQICDFVKRYFKQEPETSIMEFLNCEADAKSREFIQASISAIENLIWACSMDVDLGNDDIATLRKQILWYNSLFRKQALIIDSMPAEDDVSARRFKIAAKKLKFGSAANLSGIENIDNEKDLMEVVQLYEENFNDIRTYGFQGTASKKELERDYRDWIYAIRHEKFREEYSLEEVLTHVKNWYDLIHSPIATFYLFVVTSLLGFGTENVAGKTECLFDALDVKPELTKMSRLITRPNYPREWLGNSGKGIKRLVSGNRYVGMLSEERDGANTIRAGLAACKGTICPPNTNKLSGFIDLDLDVETVRVYYIPTRVGLEGNRYVGQRVEFNLAFSVQHGFEAFDVKLLKRHACPRCNARIEFISAEITKRCRCSYVVSKDEMNEVH